MNTIWLKVAGVIVVIVVALVVVGHFRSGEPSPTTSPQSQSEPETTEKPKTFYDMADRDKQFAEAPKPVEEPAPAPQQESAPPTAPPVAQEMEPAQPVIPEGPQVILPSELKEKRTLYFKPMSEIDDISAQELLPYATAGRSIGRLPVMQYGLMVKACRQIEERWPDSWYAFRAKQMLEEIYERYATNYKITKQELDITKFLIQRQGTEPRIVEPIR